MSTHLSNSSKLGVIARLLSLSVAMGISTGCGNTSPALDAPSGVDAADAATIDATTLFRISGTITVDGRARTFLVNLPPTYDAMASFPVIIAMHGGGGSAAQFEATNLLTPKTNQANYIVVYPDGVVSPGPLGLRTWNGGACCGYASENNIDDVKFIRELIDYLAANFKINSKRVYATGHSNGGIMSYRLACELSDRIAAISPNAAAMLLPTCVPTRPVPLQHTHSRLDTNVPILGGMGTGLSSNVVWPATMDVLNQWVTINGCATPPQVSPGANVTRTRWNQCASGSEVDYYLTEDGGHAWPGGLPGSAMGDTPSTAIDKNDLMLEFFGRHQLP